MPEEQISLFEPVLEEKRKQNEAIDAAMDSIRDKFGKYSIMHGGALGNDMGISYKESEEEEIEPGWYTKAEVRELLRSEPFAARTQAFCYAWSRED